MIITRKEIIDLFKTIEPQLNANLRSALKAPFELRQLKNKIRFNITFIKNVNPAIYIDYSKFDLNNPIEREIMFLYKGTKKHWVSLKRHKLIEDWAIRNNIVQKEGTKYKWAKYFNKRKYTTAIRVGYKSQKLYLTKEKVMASKQLMLLLLDYLKNKR